MIVLIIDKTELNKFPLLNSEGDSYWQPLNNTESGDCWLLPRAADDLDSNGILYTKGEVIIKVEEI